MKQTTKSPALLPRLSLVAIACQLACLGMSSAFAAEQPETNNDPVDSKQVTITGKKVGMGLMVQESAPKARSTINAEELAKQRPTGNAYQALELMPSVNSFNYDATGLFGGGLSLRGFNSDQIGMTINGVPVNDSGSFSLYPQEFVDQENTCTEFVTQGSTDVDSPQIGASGGIIGITTCDPSKEKRFRVAQTIGALNMYKTYMRYDTGMLSDEKTRLFISASHAYADKWKGAGGGDRYHVDMGFRTDIDRFNSISGTVLMNRELNNNINSITLSDLAKHGYYYDYSTTFIGHAAPTPGTAGSDPSQASGDSYYQLSQNPFQNVIASVTGKFRINENTDVKILPYYWYGFGTGGVQQKLMSESGFLNSATHTDTAGVDLNHDGDTKDKVIVATSSVTRTNRPGITGSVTHTIDNQQILAGFWIERADQDQFGPMVAVDANGNPTDIWLRNGRILRPDGTPYESRDWHTISTAYQFFAQDTVSLMNDKLTLNIGMRAPTMKRQFTDKASEGEPTAGYTIDRTYHDFLPQIGVKYQIDHDNQLFASLAKNMKVPGNFAYATTGNVVIVNGQPTMPVDVKQETSYNLDMGYRLQTDTVTAQATIYAVDFKDRLASTTDPVTLNSTLVDAGKVRSTGAEFEIGNTPIHGWSAYTSLGYINSQIRNDIMSSGVALPTNGKQMTDTPKWKAGISGQYETNSWYVRLKGKYTGQEFATMTNDQSVAGYTTYDFDAGYQFPNAGMFKKTTLRLNVSNITNKQYLSPSSFNVLNAVAVGAAGAKSVYYYLGAPRFVSVSLQTDF